MSAHETIGDALEEKVYLRGGANSPSSPTKSQPCPPSIMKPRLLPFSTQKPQAHTQVADLDGH